MLRCIVYVSTAVDDWPDAAVAVLLERSRGYNSSVGITGRLLLSGGRFVQVLEGPSDATGRLFVAIRNDRRHRDVVTLVDTMVADRSYHGWSMDYTRQADLGAAARASVAAFLDRVDLDAAADAEVAARIMGGSDGVLRVTPSRPGAWVTVGRLLDATLGVLRRDGIAAVDVDSTAQAANVTRQAAYRYFANGEQMLRALVRRHQLRMLLIYRAYLKESRFTSNAEVAQIVARIVQETHMARNLLPRAIALRLLRDYHEVAYEELWLLSAELQSAMRAKGLPEATLPSRTDLAAALAAVSSAAKMIILNDPDAFRAERTQGLLAGIFLGALRGGRGSPGMPVR